jgi:putative endonuclease
MKECVQYFVYVLQCTDDSLYVGSTNNREKRLKQHKELKSGAHYTKIRRAVILKYTETLKTLKEARAREAEIKSWKRNKKLELIH